MSSSAPTLIADAAEVTRTGILPVHVLFYSQGDTLDIRVLFPQHKGLSILAGNDITLMRLSGYLMDAFEAEDKTKLSGSFFDWVTGEITKKAYSDKVRSEVIEIKQYRDLQSMTDEYLGISLKGAAL